jgi:hypothetical protein
MTADEWETSNDALEMLKAVRGKWRDQDALHRRLRRYYLACCQAIWPLLPQLASRRGVEVGERYLDGGATEQEVHDAEWDAEGAAFNIEFNCDPAAIAGWVRDVEALAPECLSSLLHIPEARAWEPRKVLMAAAHFADYALHFPHGNMKRPQPRHEPFLSPRLLRCVFPNPLRRPTMLPAWRTGDVVGLARGIDEGRAYDRMPLLGDALMEAGADEQLLAHARVDGHVRGAGYSTWCSTRVRFTRRRALAEERHGPPLCPCR